MSKFRAFVKGLNWTVGEECAQVAELVDGALICILSIIPAGLSESEGTVSEAICDVCDNFPVEASSDVLDSSAGG